MSKLKYFLFFLLTISPAILAAEDTVSNAKKLNELLSHLNTFQADFEQQIFSENGELIDSLKGKVGIKKPGKFYWNVTEPFEQELIADGKYLWQYDKDLEQATVRNLDESLGNTPAEILSGKVTHLDKKYHIEYLKQDDVERFKLVPMNERQFESIVLYFKKAVLEKLILNDTLAQTTTIIFENARFGMAIPDQLFLMVLPKGTDIVDSRIKEEKYLDAEKKTDGQKIEDTSTDKR